MATENKYGKTFVTKNPIRCTFLQVHEPNGTKAEFNADCFTATMLVDPTDREQMIELRDAITGVAGVEKLSELCKHPFIDDQGKTKSGDDKDPKKYPGFAGMIPIQLTSGSEFPPTLAYVEDGTMYSFDEASLGEAQYKKMVQKIMYSGAWYHVALQAATYQDKKKKDTAVTFYLKGLIKVKDDEELSSGVNVINLFETAIPGLKSGKALFASASGNDDADDDAPPVKVAKAPAKSAMDDLDDADDDLPKPNGKVHKAAAETEPVFKKSPGRPKKASNDIDVLLGDD